MNFILIGMPGCGKTSVGKAAAGILNMKFTDLDNKIVELHGDITTIFADEGETAFRKYETDVLKTSIKYTDCIISSGGGIIETSENLKILKNQTVIFIDRSPESILRKLDSDSRPLLKGKKDAVLKLYDRRYKKYIEAMDYQIHNEGSFNECVNAIVKTIESIRG